MCPGRTRLEVVRPGGFELPTFWFVVIGSKIPSRFFDVVYELEATSEPSSIVRRLPSKLNPRPKLGKIVLES